jgi:hypothetical protein
VAQHCVGRDERARHCGGGASDRGWGSMRNGGEPTRFYSQIRCRKCSGVGEEDRVRPRSEGAALMSMHASILVDSVGPPSAEVCITAASFP